MPTFTNSPILVTGASGQLGRQVIEELLAKGATNVTGGTRDPGKLSIKGVKAARVDFDDDASMDAAFQGIARLLVISTDAVGTPGRRLEQHLKAVRAAKRAGVKHIFYTSMPSPEAGNQILVAPDHRGTEHAIKTSGMDYTILRHNWYFENTLMGMPQAIASGQLYTSAGQGGLAQASRADLARADAGALLNEATSNTYELSGPQATTMDDQATVFNRVLGTNIKVVHLDDAGLAAGMRAAQLPEAYVEFLVAVDQSIRSGWMGQVTNDIEKLSGRKPQTLEAWLGENRHLFKT